MQDGRSVEKATVAVLSHHGRWTWSVPYVRVVCICSHVLRNQSRYFGACLACRPSRGTQEDATTRGSFRFVSLCPITFLLLEPETFLLEDVEVANSYCRPQGQAQGGELYVVLRDQTETGNHLCTPHTKYQVHMHTSMRMSSSSFLESVFRCTNLSAHFDWVFRCTFEAQTKKGEEAEAEAEGEGEGEGEGETGRERKR